VHQDAVEKVSEQAMDKNVIPENMIGKSGCSIKIDQICLRRNQICFPSFLI
jgi:hypothetical protein